MVLASAIRLETAPMSDNRFAALPHEYPRTFVPEDLDAGDWDAVAPLYDALEERDLDTAEQAEAWLRDSSEVGSVLAEIAAQRYIRMTCDTENKDHEAAYLHLVQKIMPEVKKRSQTLDRKYLDAAGCSGLPETYAVFDRDTANDAELYREANVPLEVKDAETSQKYQKICGAMTVEIDGEEVTLQQASKDLFLTDRDRRESTFRKTWARRLEDREAIESLFDELVEIRRQVGLNAGFENFRDYRHRKFGRFDYTPDDCVAFHDAIEKIVMPVIAGIRRERKERLGVDALRPWDLQVDTKGREPLAPFTEAEELIAGVSRVFHGLDPVLGGQFDRMRDLGLLDLESRKGKAPGGYQYGLAEARLPFIFMNAVGLHGDVRTLLHEGGHAFHSMACRDEILLHYRHAPMEFAEVASMSMELIGAARLEEFYDEADKARAYKEMLTGALDILPWVATIDAFQHWIYTNPGHTREERVAIWRGLLERFPSGADWTGLEEIRDARWHAQTHVFAMPFYYIEYGIAQLGALQVWMAARKDPTAALTRYRQALALGGSKPLPQLFEAAGIRFDFGPDTVGPLVDAVVEELETLKDA
jgi:oligoendopeptidase F